MSFYVPKYMRVHGHHYTEYATIDSASTFVAGIATNILSAIIMKKFINNPMCKSYLCMQKAAIDIPCVAMIFL